MVIKQLYTGYLPEGIIHSSTGLIVAKQKKEYKYKETRCSYHVDFCPILSKLSAPTIVPLYW